MPDPTTDGRRRFLAYVGAATATALAGCGGGTPTPDPDAVPEQYRTATSQSGQERAPDGLSTKAAVEYQEEPEDGEQCDGCTFYIEDKNGDGLGACAIVEGTIAPDAWCVSYAAYEP